MRTEVDTVVVGGGAMGSAAAWQRARRGHDVVLLERFEPGHHRGASHGASRIFRLSYPDAPHIALAREALELWRELEQLSGSELLTITGGVSHGLPELVRRRHELAIAAGLDSELVDAAEAGRRFTGMRFEGLAVLSPDAGRVNADAAVATLQRLAASHGADIRHDSPVTALRVLGDDRVEVDTESESFTARRVIVTVGAWSEKLLGPLVGLPRLVVTQEQPVHFPRYDETARWPSFVHLRAPGSHRWSEWPAEGYGLLTPGEGLKFGFHGTGEVVDPDARSFRPDPVQLRGLQDYARHYLPGVDAGLITEISCTYTMTPDENFILDRRGPLVIGAGFSGHGFKFVPAIGRILADLADTGAAPAIFALDRGLPERR